MNKYELDAYLSASSDSYEQKREAISQWAKEAQHENNMRFLKFLGVWGVVVVLFLIWAFSTVKITITN